MEMWGLLIGRGRADKDVLPGDPREELNVALDILGRERDPVHDSIEPVPLQSLTDFFRLVNVADDVVSAGDIYLVLSSVEQVQIDALVYRQSADGSADVACAANKQDLHCILPVS